VQYLIDEVFTVPRWLIPTELSSKTYLLKNGYEEHPLTAMKNEQLYLIWDLLANSRLLRMIQAESDLGADKAFTVSEMMQMLHQSLFVAHPQPDVLQRSMQKSVVDALITAAAEHEGVKINKGVEGLDNLDNSETMPCASLTSRPRNIGFTSTQISRVSDVISLKRAELLRIRQWAKARIGNCTTAVQMHCSDIVQRIDTALGL
jgi:hypothetical protein